MRRKLKKDINIYVFFLSFFIYLNSFKRKDKCFIYFEFPCDFRLKLNKLLSYLLIKTLLRS